ncbi:MAG: bifunctional glutamate N-acetyltransferase/amino-acid acetyltransferase ArgJ [Anaerolineae bacterium]|nr:bifunctional glutamate N-acetyltransferase/amino-acid acetyltransferase ArgJ [Anaerolineae bacterium]
MVIEDGSITSTPGFQAAGVACGIKPNGKPDVAMIYSQRACVAAALFTTNAFKAAPVLYDQDILTRNSSGLHAVLINSGCANACTGQRGLADAAQTAAAVAELLRTGPDAVMVMSTGVIGAHLPMDKLLAGVHSAARELSDDVEAGHVAARAIMTTDTRPKEQTVRVGIDGQEITIAGMVKGAGMIHPNMATLLCAITSDVRITPRLAQAALREAADQSFHLMTIDGDTSTNDTLLLMANGLAEMQMIDSEGSPAYRAFKEGLTLVAQELAKAVARDGEGATRFIEIHVQGARDKAEAKQVGMSVARSSLVKTAIYGQDANWGRIICAVGYSGVEIVPEKVRVWLGDLELVRDGAPYDVDEERASEILAQPDVPIRVDLAQGNAEVTVWTCDLTHDYVSVNAHYRT